MAVYLGSTIPVIGACAAGVFGLFAFSDNNTVNQIRVVSEGPNYGLLEIDVGTTVFSSHKILVDVKNLHSVIALDNDNLGEEDEGDNVLEVNSYIEVATGKQVEDKLILRLPADSFRNKVFLDWIISEKDQEGELADDYQHLLTQRHILGQAMQSNALALFTGSQETSLTRIDHAQLDMLIDSNHPRVEQKLIAMEKKYGKEYLEKLEDAQFYNLYKKHF